MGKPLEIKEGTVFGHYAFFPHRFRKVDDDWVAQIKINGKRVLLGRFSNEIDASNAYQSKLKEIIN
jgi:hypothetical protein